MNCDICVIIPTIRKFDVIKDYIVDAKEHSFNVERLHFLIVTEDFCDIRAMEKFLEKENVSGEVFDEKRRLKWFKERHLEEYSDMIPKKSHAETSFGLLYMWANENFRYGVFIDDDTLPHPNFNFFQEHLNNLEFKGEINMVSSDKKWVNVLYQNFKRHGLYPRGYPYSCMAEKISIEKKYVKDVVVSQGLWTNIPDLDAVRILVDGDLNGRAKTLTNIDDFKENFVVAKNNFLTVCSMNLAFKREIIPAFYQLPMDDNKWRIGRFDDIWSGIFLKKICDNLEKNIISGFPLCIHNKEKRNTFKDLNCEVAALELNEHLWKEIDDINFKAKNIFSNYLEIALLLKSNHWTYINGKFLNYVGSLMERWLECLRRI